MKFVEGKERKEERERMVENLIRDGKVWDYEVLRAMRRVPRHLFVTGANQDSAYEDKALPLAWSKEEVMSSVSQPTTIGIMLQLLELSRKDKVLEVGTGTGYQAALLSMIVAYVYTIEMEANLASKAREILAKLGTDNVRITEGDGREGWEQNAPFNAIIVAAMAEDVPPRLIEQLDVEGRLVMPIKSKREGDFSADLVLVRKTKHGVKRTVAEEGFGFVQLLGVV